MNRKKLVYISSAITLSIILLITQHYLPPLWVEKKDVEFQARNSAIASVWFESAVRYFGERDFESLMAPAKTYTPPKAATWLENYPVLRVINPEKRTALIKQLRTSESISQLIGPMENPYGVRDDIFYKILKIVPPTNPRLLRAEIAAAHYETLMFYSVADKERIFYLKKYVLAAKCALWADTSRSAKLDLSLVRTMLKGMRNTKLRAKHIAQVEHTTFAGQAIQSGYSPRMEEHLCSAENY